ncbi:MAG: ISAzo13 family transposase [Bacteroidota bacterium]|nr:ISAzo13 family transposase [Bacteroidota bacterium]
MRNSEIKIQERINYLLPVLNERQRRIYLATEAKTYGYGGVSLVSRLSNISRPTITQGAKDIGSTIESLPRSRKSGGGRKPVHEKYKGILKDLESLIEPLTIGDPMSPLRWTVKSTRNLSEELQAMGYKVSHTAVSDMLKLLNYSLQSTRKRHEGGTHPDRNRQFEYINGSCERHIRTAQPVISVDTKKKEQIGNYKNPGKSLQKAKQPTEVEVYDFAKDKAVPFGVYDLKVNEGFVNVGINYDTSAFAVESIRRWWYNMGREKYQSSTSLLITADGGGSNGYRRKLWKTELQKFANETGLSINVCHFPPGTSKWNKIEHRLCSHITMNWQGKPLESYETVVNLISSTKTRKGLRVKAILDENVYEKGIKVPDKELESINIFRHAFHGDWNYTIKPIIA